MEIRQICYQHSWAAICFLGRCSSCTQKFSIHVEEGEADFTFEVGIDTNIRSHYAKYYRPGDFPGVTEDGIRITELDSLKASGEGLETHMSVKRVKLKLTPTLGWLKTLVSQQKNLIALKMRKLQLSFSAKAGDELVLQNALLLLLILQKGQASAFRKADTY